MVLAIIMLLLISTLGIVMISVSNFTAKSENEIIASNQEYYKNRMPADNTEEIIKILYKMYKTDFSDLTFNTEWGDIGMIYLPEFTTSAKSEVPEQFQDKIIGVNQTIYTFKFLKGGQSYYVIVEFNINGVDKLSDVDIIAADYAQVEELKEPEST
jgi:hypothetical protein